MENLQIFENEQFGEIRTVEINGEPHFVASDVAKALGYKNVLDAIGRHCRWVVKHDIPHPQNKNKTLEVNCIPIGDLFRLAASSELPGAKQFESWIYDEVLPMLHKTGKYEMPKQEKQPASPMELLKLEFEALKEVDGKIEAVNNDLQKFKKSMPLLGVEESRITRAVQKKGLKCLGGKNSAAYQDLSVRGRVYADIYRQLKREFGVNSYKAIQREKCDYAVGIVEGYKLPHVLAEKIKSLNLQMSMGGEAK